jgi:hypothetical protein
MELHEIITAEVNEKRRRNDINKGTKLPETNLVHNMDTELLYLRPSQSSPPTQPGQPQTDVPMTDAQPKEKKYRLRSELRETVPITEIARKS